MILILDNWNINKEYITDDEINQIIKFNKKSKIFDEIIKLTSISIDVNLNIYKSEKYNFLNSIILTKNLNINYTNFSSIIILITNEELKLWKNYNCPYIDGKTNSIKSFFESKIVTLLGEKVVYQNNKILNNDKLDLSLSALIYDPIIIENYEIKHYSLGRYFVDKSKKKSENPFKKSMVFYNRTIIINKFNDKSITKENEKNAFNDKNNAQKTVFRTIFKNFIRLYNLFFPNDKLKKEEVLIGYPPSKINEINRFKYISKDNIFLLIKEPANKNKELGDKIERMNNLSDCYEINNIIKNSELNTKKIILIDDVFTTGATFETLIRILLKHCIDPSNILVISFSKNYNYKKKFINIKCNEFNASNTAKCNGNLVVVQSFASKNYGDLYFTCQPRKDRNCNTFYKIYKNEVYNFIMKYFY